MRRALVFGGTGYLGSAVLRGLAEADVPAEFTWHTSAERARALEAELKQRAHGLDARDAGAIRRLCASLESEGRTPDVVVHCLGVGQDRALADISEEDWAALHAINVRSAFLAIQSLAGPMAARGGGDIVLTASYDGSRPMPVPAHFAATQGALCAMVRALSKELGPKGIRVNLVTPGLLEGGVSQSVDARLGEDFRKFSAYGRRGNATEVSRAILWLALHNTYMTGAVLAVNGGL
ncbi:SDR family oxidoreductase [Archangium violaceum]|uniref:SDR family NAD(P)-dependent oxidoreductase n=1 Tax=Archangium violaceum TaxID=83451 RepID=UPI00194E9735|nr:SDR family oxidoreductase [Archangium violaceum]QRN92942.1 SDR family oxidoreductase [Archangium violaceum]